MTFFKREGLQRIVFAFSASFLSIATFSSSVFALDSNKRITQYDIRLYQAEHGLPMNDLKAVFQDSKGYIWLGCQEGLVRFDGVRFVLFDKSKYPGLRENFIWDIKEDWEGNLWLATNGGGVSRFDGKTFTTFDTSDGLAHNVVKCILMLTDRAIWFGTEGGLSYYKNGKFTNRRSREASTEMQQINCLLEDDSGHLVVGRRHHGIDVLIDGEFQHFPTDSGSASAIFRRASGEILAGTDYGRVYVYRQGRFDKFNPYQLPTTQTINAIFEDREGSVWFCTDGNGVVRYANGRFESLKAENGLPEGHNFFLRVMEDRERSLWFVGDGGLLRLMDNKFTAFGRNEGFLTNFGNTICEDRNGNMWAGLRQGGLVKFDKYMTQVWTVDNGLLTNEVVSVLPAQNGGLWIGTALGLNYLRNEKLIKTLTAEYYQREGAFVGIRALSETNRGELWLGTFYGYMTKLKDSHFDTLRLAGGESGSVICVHCCPIEAENAFGPCLNQGVFELTFQGQISRLFEHGEMLITQKVVDNFGNDQKRLEFPRWCFVF